MRPHVTSRSTALASVASVGLLAVATLGVAAPSAAALDTPTTLVSVSLTDARPSMAGGYTVLDLEVELADPDGLPDVLQNFDGQPFPVGFASVERTTATSPTDFLRTALSWDLLERTAGTETAGTWTGSAVVTSVSTGTVQVTDVVVTDSGGTTTELVVDDGPSVVVTGPAGLPWEYRVLNAPIKVVNGTERWTPSLQLVWRDSKAPVAGAASVATSPGIVDTPLWAWSTTIVEPEGLPWFPRRASSTGGLTLPSYGVQETHFVGSLAGWGSGAGRYYTVAAVGILEPPVKWQANARFTTSGGDVVMNGNAWPAPSIYDAANPTIHLQRLVGRTWRTEASGYVRSNGRFTVVWEAPPSTGYWVRAYKPGGIEGHDVSAGTVGPAVWVVP